MRYKLVRDEETGRAKRLESDGETIWEYNSGGFSIQDPNFLEAILDDANFGQPQKDALRALVIGPDEEFEDDPS